MSFAPTDEQVQAIDLARTGDLVVIEALAGTGKTSTLKLIAADQSDRFFVYTAFNRGIVEEAKGAFTSNVKISTMHGLASAAARDFFDFDWNKRWRSGRRMKAADLAKMLGIHEIHVTAHDGKRKRLAPGFLAGKVMATVKRFAQSGDDKVLPKHMPTIPGLDAPRSPNGKGMRGSVNFDLAPTLAMWAQRVWDTDLTVPKMDGARYEPSFYLKMWQLGMCGGPPRITADVILFDEAQDTDPVMASVIAAQHGRSRVIYVGDSHQEIYGWRGAVNAMGQLDTPNRCYLTASFRFGQAIADKANEVLAELGSKVLLEGLGPEGYVGEVTDPDVTLCRTNAGAMDLAFQAMAAGKTPAIVGGADEMVAFAQGAMELQEKRWTPHRELGCFASWQEVQDYVAEDPLGDELALQVRLVDNYGARRIVAAFESMPSDPDTLFSTSHKVKGLQWPRVLLGSDFPDRVNEKTGVEMGDEEKRLVYVAATRAQVALDVRSVPLFAEPGRTAGPAPDAVSAAAVEPVGEPEQGSRLPAPALPHSRIVRRTRPSGDQLYCVACRSHVEVDPLDTYPLNTVTHLCGTSTDIASWDLPEPNEVKGKR